VVDQPKKGGSSAAKKAEEFRGTYDASGELVNKKKAFESRGYRVGSKVAAVKEVTGFENGKQRTVDKNTLGTVIAVDDKQITVKLQPSGTVMWDWEVFPFEAVTVQATPKEAGDVVNLAEAGECPITATVAYKVAMAKATMLYAIEAMRLHFSTAAKVVTPYAPEGGGVVPLRVQMKPRKGVFATRVISVLEPLVLLPETTSLSLVERDQRAFLKTNMQVGAQVLALGSVFNDPLSAKDGRPGVVVYFWLVRRSEEEDECNMKIVDGTVISGTGVTWSRGKLATQSMGDVAVPMMMSTSKVQEGAELVCYYKDDAPALKKARVG